MIFRVEPVEPCAHVINFAVAMIVLALAQAGTAKIESQHRKSEAVQRLHGVKDNLVVQRPPKQRMRMANQSGMRRILRASIEQRLEPPCGAVKKE